MQDPGSGRFRLSSDRHPTPHRLRGMSASSPPTTHFTREATFRCCRYYDAFTVTECEVFASSFVLHTRQDIMKGRSRHLLTPRSQFSWLATIRVLPTRIDTYHPWALRITLLTLLSLVPLHFHLRA